MKKTENFFNKLAKELDKQYFPNVKYYGENKNCADTHHTIELFNNGVLTYDNLIKRLSKSCKDTKENIHNTVKKYIADFEDYSYNV